MNKLLTEKDFIEAAQILNCETAKIKAVCEVEAPKGGFIQSKESNGNLIVDPRILFEPFQFGRLTNHAFNGATCIIKASKYPLSLRGKWNAVACKYGTESIQHEKLREAVKL